MKLGIGTVQFGLNYGISNNDGQTSIDEVKKIFEIAQNSNINFIDTAYLYGNSEEIIGKALPENNSFKIITKTAKDLTDKIVVENLKESLNRLNQKNIYGLMLHNADDLINDDGQIIDKLNELKEKNIIAKYGVSIYTEIQIDKILNKVDIDIIQVPVNVFDQRLIKSGSLKKLKEKNIEIYVRSVFLQGLLLMDIGKIPQYFNEIIPLIKKYHEEMAKLNISPLEGALGFVKNLEEVDYIVCGINNSLQLKEIITAYNKDINFDFSSFAIEDEKYINPSNWRL